MRLIINFERTCITICFMVIVLCLFTALPSHAQVFTRQNNSQLLPFLMVNDNKLEELSSSKFWYKLLHYKKKPLSLTTKVTSQVITDNFFLSENGHNNPLSELKATIQSMMLRAGEDTDSHAQCRFPARLIWLKSVMPLVMKEIPEVSCPSFKDWTSGNKVDSISLFFAAGYLGNPASYYGHILLRINTSKRLDISDLLSTSLDYGAILEKDNALVYTLKGLFGGYEAGFTHGFFYSQNHNYGEHQLRDLWEYRLNLTEHQKQLIVAHTWELLRNKFVYYFFRENCAYAMAELVELVIDEALFERRVPWVVPQSIFRSASDVQNGVDTLVSKVTLHRSLQSRLYQNYKELTDSEKMFIKKYTEEKSTFASQLYNSFPVESKTRVVNTLLSYFQYRIIDAPEDTYLKTIKREVLIQRLSLPMESPKREPKYNLPADVIPPHEGQSPIMLRIGGSFNSKFGDGVRVQFRPAYFDTLSSDVGRPENATLAMANVEAIIYDGHTQLKRFDIIDIEAFNTSKTRLHGDGSYLWKLNIGVRSQNLDCHSCLTSGVEVGLGQSYLWEGKGVFFAAIDGRFQTSYQDSGAIVITPRLGFISDTLKLGKSGIWLGYRDFLESDKHDDWVVKLEHRIGNGRDWDLRLSYERDVAEQYSVSISRYW